MKLHLTKLRELWKRRFHRHPRTPLNLASQYCRKHPEARNEILKAGFAWHELPYETPLAHFFTGPIAKYREQHCVKCGRTREQVRYDDLPGRCVSTEDWMRTNGLRGDWKHVSQLWMADILLLPKQVEKIKDVLAHDIALYDALLQRAKTHIPKLVAKQPITGAALAYLHSTYGYDPEVVAEVLGILVEPLWPDYIRAMELEQTKSRAAHKTKPVTISI